MIKKILYFIAVVIIIALSSVLIFFDDIAKNVAVSYAQKSFKTPVEIAEFKSDWLAKTANVDFITVKNPAHFSNENAFVLKRLSIELAAEQQDKLIMVDRLEFDGLAFTLEQNKNQVNLVELLKKLEKQSASIQKSTAKKSSYRLKIKQLSFINTQLLIDTQWFKKTTEVSDIIINKFGDEQGIPVEQVGTELMKIALTRIKSEVEKNGLQLGEKEIKASVKHKLRKTFDKLTNDLDSKAKKWLQNLGL